MATFVYNAELGRMVDKTTGEPMVDGPYKPVCPQVVADIEPYQSPVSGEYVSGRRAKRADLDKNDCIDAAEFGPVKKPEFKNKAFLKKRPSLIKHAREDVRIEMEKATPKEAR